MYSIWLREGGKSKRQVGVEQRCVVVEERRSPSPIRHPAPPAEPPADTDSYGCHRRAEESGCHRRAEESGGSIAVNCQLPLRQSAT